MLLPISLVKFQVPGNVPAAGAENQHFRKPRDIPFEFAVDPTESETDNAAKHHEGNQQQDAVINEFIPPIATEESDIRVNTTNIGRREGDEFDSIVAEVQKAADLVISRSQN